MKIRPATNADRSEIEDLIFPILRSYGLEPAPESTDADLADIESNYFQKKGFFDVLIDDTGKIVGTVAIYQTDEHLCELRKLYLAKSARGSGQGTNLMGHAIDRARELGYSRMWLETADSLVEAFQLYTRFGFVPFTSTHNSARCDFALVKDL